MPIWLAVVLGAALVAVVTVAAAPYTVTYAALNPTRLTRAVRTARTWLVCGIAAVLGWPHLIDRLIRRSRRPEPRTPGAPVWHDGRATLIRYEGSGAGAPLLLVHSMVTRPSILDLAPGASLVGALVDAGFDVFLLDWGDPTRADAHRGFDAYLDTLRDAESAVLRTTGASRLHIVGYCAGALIALLRSVRFDDSTVASLTAIAPPVDYAVPGGAGRMMTWRAFKPSLVLDGDGCVPAAVIRESFHLLSPRALRGIVRGFRVRHDPARFAVYSALAEWVWDQRRLTGALFIDTVTMIRANAVVSELREAAPRAAARRRASGLPPLPVFLAVAENDHIVPKAASEALREIGGLDIRELCSPGGHVSMVSGASARRSLWPALTAWLAQHPAGDRTEPARAVSS